MRWRIVLLVALGTVITAGWGLAQTPAAAGSANPELIAALSKELGSTPAQAEGAAGALFGLAKTRLKPDDFAKVSNAVPGMDSLLKAAPAVGTSGVAGTAEGALTQATGGAASGATGLASVAGQFTKLGLKPEMAAKAVPILTSYVTKTGGADVGNLLAGALK
jgi:hypothetical protein